MYDGMSMLIGILVGVMIAFILFWIFYSTRILVFAYVPKTAITCRSSQYFNNPENAIREGGAKVENILHVDDRGRLVYTRPPKEVCMPGSNQSIILPYSEYCEFEDVNGEVYEAKNTSFSSPEYVTEDGITIFSRPFCQPQYNSGGLELISGKPLVKWDAY